MDQAREKATEKFGGDMTTMIPTYGHANHHSPAYDFGMIRDLVAELGGFAFNARSEEAADIALRIREETGCKLCMVLAHEFGDWDWETREDGSLDNERLIDVLYPVRHTRPDVVVTHWEMPKDSRRKQPTRYEWEQVVACIRMMTGCYDVCGYDFPGVKIDRSAGATKDGCGLSWPFSYSSTSLYSGVSVFNQMAALLSLTALDGDPAFDRFGHERKGIPAGNWNEPERGTFKPGYHWIWPELYDDACIEAMAVWLRPYISRGYIEALHVYPGLCEAKGSDVKRVHDRLRRLVKAIG